MTKRERQRDCCCTQTCLLNDCGREAASSGDGDGDGGGGGQPQGRQTDGRER